MFEHLGVGVDAPAFTGCDEQTRPPVAVSSHAPVAILIPVHQDARPAFVAISDGLFRRLKTGHVTVAADPLVQHFIRLVVILKQAGEGVVGFHADLPFKPLACFLA